MTARVLPVAIATLALSACHPFGSFMVRPLDVPVAPVPDSSDPMEATDHERVWQAERAPAQASRDVVRFVAVGDLGMRQDSDPTLPHPYARRLADLAGSACGRLGGCDFTVWLGDNVQPFGVTGPGGEAFLTDLALAWRDVGPIYTVLGDEDWGPVFPSQRRARRELSWVHQREQIRDGRSPNALDVRGDAHFWSFRTPLIDVHAIDTGYIVRRCRVDGEQVSCRHGDAERVVSDLAPMEAIGRDAGSRWSIVFGHHPYLAPGRRGEAGALRDAGLPIWPGDALEVALERHVVGTADLYVAAHDHGMLFTAYADGVSPGRTGFVVAGAGATTDGRRASHDRIAEHEDRGEIGLTVVEATHDELTVRFYALAHGSAEPRFVSCRGGSRFASWRYGDEACAPIEEIEAPEAVVSTP